jgi:hypothetical protein
MCSWATEEIIHWGVIPFNMIFTIVICSHPSFSLSSELIFPEKQKMSTKLWVEHKANGSTLIDKVAIEGCDHIHDFLKKIKEEFDLPVPAVSLFLYHPNGTTEIDVGAFPAEYLDGNSRTSPLVVRPQSSLIQARKNKN